MFVTADFIEQSIFHSCKGRSTRPYVRFVLENLPNIVKIIYDTLEDGSWVNHICYRDLVKKNTNGKIRYIKSPDFITLIFQHIANDLVESEYNKQDNNIGLNCKPKHGITAKIRRNSVVKRLKNIYYDRRDMDYGLVIDQRKCYMHIRPKVARKALKQLLTDKEAIDFIIKVSFVDNQLPIGTPSSPLMHHIVMLKFDKWIYKNYPTAIRYADDIFVAFASKQEAQQMKWRVKQFWWYEYGVRSKSVTQCVFSLLQPIDFCGFVFHRNSNKTITCHDKGYASIRNNIYKRGIACKTNESYASYFGLFKNADMYNVLTTIEAKNMKLRELTKKIKINRKLDAPNIDIKELVEKQVLFDIFDFDIRSDAKGKPNWIKCLIGIPEIKADKPTGKQLAYEFHGGYVALAEFLNDCQLKYSDEEFLPITDVQIEQHCGYIFAGSTNMRNYISEDEYYG